MGKCPNCGNKGIFLKTVKCKVCGKEGCEKCSIYLLSIRAHVSDAEGYTLQEWEKWYACSERCREAFAGKIKDEISLKDVDVHATWKVENIQSVVKRTILKPDNKEWISDDLRKKIAWLDKRSQKNENEWWDIVFGKPDEFEKNPLWQQLKEQTKKIAMGFWLSYAKDLEKARRFEEAARIYERYGMYEEAGKVRAKGDVVIVKTTGVTVDLNKLLQQVKDGGLVVIYRCPHCNGNIKIGKETGTESLQFCAYCGMRIEMLDLMEFLRSALS
jgi:hypothetical protein